MSRSIPAFVQPCTWAPDADSSLPPQCLKITEKVSFNTASEASYVYIFSGQKCQKTLLADRSLLVGQKSEENAKMEKKNQCDFLGDFQTLDNVVFYGTEKRLLRMTNRVGQMSVDDHYRRICRKSFLPSNHDDVSFRPPRKKPLQY